MIAATALAENRRTAGLLRTAVWLGLAAFEAAATSYLLDIRFDLPRYLLPTFWALFIVRWAAVAAVGYLLLVWPQRSELTTIWRSAQRRHAFHAALFFNLALFGVLALCSHALTQLSKADGGVASSALFGYAIVLALTGMSLIRLDIPLSAFRSLGQRFPTETVVAIVAGLIITIVAEASTFAWTTLAPATLGLVALILGLYEPSLMIDYEQRFVQVENFRVTIHEQCSGYEGLALVAGFVSIYLYVFRASLRFPRALLLYPIGLAAIWLLNSVRIVALTSLGAHVSPRVAAQGFHSQAGWITFLVVTVGLMALAQNLGLAKLRAADADVASPANPDGLQRSEIVNYLGPFVALMVGGMAIAAAVPNEHPIYLVKAVLVAAALIALRRWLGTILALPSIVAVVAGAGVGFAWIVTAPAVVAEQPLGVWLGSIGPGLAAGWLLVRGIGTAILVPIAEELAFRGYLYRRLQSADFQSVPTDRLAWLAVAGSSLVFGCLHGRLLAAGLAGLVFALVMVRRGRLSDAIWAHGTANGLIFLWAVVQQDWSLL